MGCCNWKAPIVNHHITNANIKEWARDYDGPQFDGILCDPPYELGFMGKSWDSSGIAFDQDMWADLFRHIKPGGHLLAFSGSRTYHRMAVAIEDAGFEIRDMIEWVYGSGFPKSLNIGKAVDKLQGNEREVIGIDKNAERFKEYKEQDGCERKTFNDKITKGTSPFEGYGTQLKPAHEPICMARKPLSEKSIAENCLKWGTGGINIDESRVGTETIKNNQDHKSLQKFKEQDGRKHKEVENPEPTYNTGRFPANLIHDGSDEVEAVFPQTKAGVAVRRNKGIVASKNVTFNANDPTNTEDVGYGDSGSASRFFYTAKSSKSERNAGLEGFEEKPNLRVNAPRENEEAKHSNKMTNFHPTVKPLSLTKYLANLIKPPTDGRLLVPFSGSGSEMIGALQAGWEYVEGVELTEEYIPIAEARIKYWLDQMAQEDAKPKQESLL